MSTCFWNITEVGNMKPSDIDEKDVQSKLRIGIFQLDVELGAKLKLVRTLPTSLPLEARLAQVGLLGSSESEDSNVEEITQRT